MKRITIIKMSKKINPKAIIFKGKTSIFVFLYPSLISIIMLWYFIDNKTIFSFLLFFSLSAIMFFLAGMNFFKKELILTPNSVYIYANNNLKFSLNLLSELHIIDIRQEKLGRIFNFGTLVFLKNDKTFYEFFFINDPKKCLEKIMIRYEKNVLKINPNFETKYFNKENNRNEKKLDSIED